jgi:6-phosphogluconate dehydrogenase
MKYDIGLIGLAVMGENLALNMESKGFTVAVYNRTTAKVDEFINGKAAGKAFVGVHSLAELTARLKSPRVVMLMVKAGKPVDDMIESILPHLATGDILIDGGNSFFEDTRRRTTELAAKGIRYIGMGVSGGEEGALKGPSLMPGGDKAAYEAVAPLFTAIAAQVADGPCCSYVGPDGAGHYVKMVHNGIEYGDMQLICEAYALLSEVAGLSANELHGVFAEWNLGELDSYLIEITRDIFAVIDETTGRPLVEMILDKAEQKGTGKWTSQSALDLGVPTPTITEAVFARCMSSYKDERVQAAAILQGPNLNYSGDKQAFIKAIHDALYASKICSYAQGFALLRAASQAYGWDLNFGDMALLWRGGCIIRARFLERIKDAYRNDQNLANLMLDPFFASVLERTQANWRQVVITAKQLGVPTPAFSSSLDYFDSYRRATLPANLLQAQRDYFGAHTYERVDRPGKFHTDWVSRR